MAFAPIFQRPFNATFDRRAAAGNGLLNNLVAYWSLNETTGTRYDSVGTAHLADIEGVGYATGKIGNAADFIRTNLEYLSVTNAALNYAAGESFSITCWFKLDVIGTNYYILAQKDPAPFTEPSTGRQWSWVAYISDSSKAGIGISSTGKTWAILLDLNQVLTTGVWYFYCGQFNFAQGKAYISIDNCTPVSANVASMNPNGTGPMFIARHLDPDTYTDGLIDEMGIWKRALTATDITALYNSGAGLPYAAFTT